MGNSWIWIGVAVLGVLFLVYALLYKKGKTKFDFRNLFNLGLVFMALGVYEIIRDGGSLFFLLGVIYIAVGYSKKKDWKKK